jgi:hypothetical protein
MAPPQEPRFFLVDETTFKNFAQQSPENISELPRTSPRNYENEYA